MRLLLDTHVFLWLNTDTSQLTTRVKQLLVSGEHELYLSMASAWEMQIKHQLGKLNLSTSIKALIAHNVFHNRIQLLPITLENIVTLESLPPHHKDPFDCMLIAQASSEDMTLFSADHVFTQYDIRLVW
jgi:PIN domain nuclease of toxin-antitoxin system